MCHFGADTLRLGTLRSPKEGLSIADESHRFGALKFQKITHSEPQPVFKTYMHMYVRVRIRAFEDHCGYRLKIKNFSVFPDFYCYWPFLGITKVRLGYKSTSFSGRMAEA